MKWCQCGHASTSHTDETGPCRSLVSNLAGQTSDCPCTEMQAVEPDRPTE